ncbi:MAG: cytochrome P450 [Gammaproteobacteria bacterium]|jgi:cytochrome P450|nr:cytochrome P450 [Gammaproteobacteria bacterium]MBU0769802.1 cytochrome P450 [Gammaproteobacteria bacterium]MBU0858286.1 cytochrome P450 [Gammaproteobacteria bacterium]MBU1845872.1 cytochrome P450 [Gammaproteobacteria bacterium]
MFDQAFIENPYPTYHALREGGAAHFFPEFLGGAWLLPRHAEIGPLLRDPRLSAARSQCYSALLPAEVHADFAEFDRLFSMWMLFLDAPEHTLLRKLLNKGFAPQLMEMWRDAIEHTVNDLLERFPLEGSVEFMGSFAHPIPIAVICELMGVNKEDQAQFIDWSDDIARFFGNPASSLDNAFRGRDSLLAMIRYFEAVIETRRAAPGNDLVSLLIRIEEDEEALSGEQVAAQCSMLLFGGHETTRNLIGTGLLALLQHPDQLQALRDDPSLIPNAVREILRYDSPVQYLTRIAATDFEYAGAQIRRGQMVVPLIASANRDAERYPDPDRFDVHRADTTHFSFGHGAHVCIGTRLALMEAEIALHALLQRFDTLELVDSTPDWMSNFGFRGLNTLMLNAHSTVAPARAQPAIIV